MLLTVNGIELHGDLRKSKESFSFVRIWVKCGSVFFPSVRYGITITYCCLEFDN